MCKPVKKTPCGTSYTFNDEEKTKILKFHNDIRRKTASGKETNTSGKLPPACEMCDLQWNDEAAKIAQKHTNDCKFEHDEERSLCDGSKFNSNWGHYSQLIWADTCHIGCGLTYFQEDGKWNYLVACNYCKAGNYKGEKVYKTPCDSTPHCDDCVRFHLFSNIF
ncbi:Venom allergen 5 [Armadillidium nasatum]|uniref:Venom allergen 5 n=1 Tax=Armadillidium nasatum TaxID=96803 RepID=A0A5N5T952_9CRUS|nr:Venom allergen 5 [Armadillidium nasatum]